MSCNATLLEQKYDRLNAPYRARVASHINKLDMLPSVLVSVVASYLYDEELLTSMSNDLFKRVCSGEKTIRSRHLANDMRFFGNVIYVCVRAHKCSVRAIYSHYITAHCEDRIVKSLDYGEGWDINVNPNDCGDVQYMINQPCECSKRFRQVIKVMERMNGCFDEWGNLWL